MLILTFSSFTIMTIVSFLLCTEQMPKEFHKQIALGHSVLYVVGWFVFLILHLHS